MARIVSACTVVALILVLGVPRAAWAEDEAGAESYRLELPAPISLEDALLMLRQDVGLPLVWDPKSRAITGKELAGGIVLQGSADDIYAAARSLLAFYELVLVPVGAPDNEKILVMDGRQTSAIVKLKPMWVELEDGNLAEYEKQDGLFLTTVIRTQHLGDAGLTAARNALNRIVTGQNIGNVTEVPAAQGFVVTDFAPNVVAIYRLIRQMDVPRSAQEDDPSRLQVAGVRLEHAPAMEALAALRALTQHPASAALGAPAAQAGAVQAADLEIAADPRTNQILLQGPADAVERAKQALQLIDQPRPEANVEIQLLRLEHAQAQSVAPVLIQLVGGWFQAGQGRLVSEPRPTVVAYPQSNALVVAATERTGTAIRHLVAELDRDLAAEAAGAPGAVSPSGPAEPDADAKVRERITTGRISLSVGGTDLPAALVLWAEQAGVPLVITPAAHGSMLGQQVVLDVSDRSASLVLQVLVNAGGPIRWTVADGAVVVHQQGERL